VREVTAYYVELLLHSFCSRYCGGVAGAASTTSRESLVPG
jgi:hypothetical protein